MPLLVHYTLKSADDRDHQVAAMTALVEDLKSEGAAGTDGLHYSCYTTEDPVRFVGVLQFDSDVGKDAFLNSEAFATYKAKVGPTFANPPEAVPLSSIASTRGA